MDHIKRILAGFPFVVLDGGFATELEKMGFNLKNRLWSANVLSESPESVRAVHLSYLEAGADCIISSSYQATIPGFMASGFSRNESEELIRLSLKLAQEAVKLFMEREEPDPGRPVPFVAASAGCYGAYLADGSEYNGSYKLSSREYIDFHKPRIDVLANFGADFIAFETFPNIEEALAVSELMLDYTDTHYWIVFTAADERHISHGDLFSDCVKELCGKPNIAGVGINCSRPELISPLLRSLDSFSEIPLVVYPNSGEVFNIDCTCWTDESSRGDFRKLAEEWYNTGAKVIGGCCRTGPDDIKEIRDFRNSL